METKKRIQFAMDIEQELRQEIKVRAALRGIPMSTWIKRAIKERIQKEDMYK